MFLVERLSGEICLQGMFWSRAGQTPIPAELSVIHYVFPPF